jgi:hypothetical protein
LPLSQIKTVLAFVAEKVPFDLPPDVGGKIADDSNGNLRKAILVLEALKVQSYESFLLLLRFTGPSATVFEIART